jgi:hypothetical protein
LTNYDDLLIAAQKLNYINEEEQTRLQKWNSDPNDESWMLNH